MNLNCKLCGFQILHKNSRFLEEDLDPDTKTNFFFF